MTGTLSYLPFAKGTAYKPLGGHPVKIYNPSGLNPNTPVASGTTNASGDFSIKLPTSGLPPPRGRSKPDTGWATASSARRRSP